MPKIGNDYYERHYEKLRRNEGKADFTKHYRRKDKFEQEADHITPHLNPFSQFPYLSSSVNSENPEIPENSRNFKKTRKRRQIHENFNYFDAESGREMYDQAYRTKKNAELG